MGLNRHTETNDKLKKKASVLRPLGLLFQKYFMVEGVYWLRYYDWKKKHSLFQISGHTYLLSHFHVAVFPRTDVLILDTSDDDPM